MSSILFMVAIVVNSLHILWVGRRVNDLQSHMKVLERQIHNTTIAAITGGTFK